MTQYHQNKWREENTTEEPLQICYSFWVS